MAGVRFDVEEGLLSVKRVAAALKPAPRRMKQDAWRLLVLGSLPAAAGLLTVSCATWMGKTAKDKHCAFIGFTKFSAFAKSPGASNNETIFLSPEIRAPIEWNELV